MIDRPTVGSRGRLLGGLALCLLTLVSCQGEARKLRDLLKTAQERHGGRDRFNQTGTYFAHYDIDDYSGGTPRAHQLQLKQSGDTVRSEYAQGGILVTTVANRGSDQGWKRVADTSGNSQVRDLQLPNDQLLAELFCYELDATDVFRLERFLKGPSPDSELGAKMKVEPRYERYEAADASALVVEGQELEEQSGIWMKFTLKYIFDSAGTLTRKEKVGSIPDKDGNEIGQMQTEIRYLDYQETGGFRVPYRVEYRVNGDLTQIYRLREFKPKVYWDPTIFVDPRSIEAAQATEEAAAATPDENEGGGGK